MDQSERLRALSFASQQNPSSVGPAIQLRGYLQAEARQHPEDAACLAHLMHDAEERILQATICAKAVVARNAEFEGMLSSMSAHPDFQFPSTRQPLDLVAAFAGQSAANAQLLQQSADAKAAASQAKTAYRQLLQQHQPPPFSNSSGGSGRSLSGDAAVTDQMVVDLTSDEDQADWSKGGSRAGARINVSQRAGPDQRTFAASRPAPAVRPGLPKHQQPCQGTASWVSNNAHTSGNTQYPCGQHPATTCGNGVGSSSHGQPPGSGAGQSYGRGGFSVPPQKRPAPGPPAGSGYGSKGYRGAGSSSNGQDIDTEGDQEGNGRPAFGGFETAKTQLVRDMMKKGQVPPANLTAAPRTYGLPRPKPTGASAGFKKPWGEKEKKTAQKVSYAPGAGAGASGGDWGEDCPFPHRLMDLLAAKGLLGPEQEVPEPITRLDTKLLETVCNEILDSSGSIGWDAIAGQAPAKRLIQELVVWPIMNPSIFKGARTPAKGLLLFGPPGTGKTMIGKAIASNIAATFFSISSSSLTSKWIGDGEKMVRVLFALAGVLEPSVIFIDEIDSVLSARKAEGEHESSRRLKTEILVQMEGCNPESSDRKVLIVGATNRPEELDEAARRRLPKQLYIPLPCQEARKYMIMHALGPNSGLRCELSDTELNKIVDKTEGYSGSDMKNLIQEASQGPVRDAIAHYGTSVKQLREEDLRPIVLRDFQMAHKAQKASVTTAEVERYELYDQRHGAKYVEPNTTEAMVDDEEAW